MIILMPKVLKTCEGCKREFDALASVDGLKAVYCSPCTVAGR